MNKHKEQINKILEDYKYLEKSVDFPERIRSLIECLFLVCDEIIYERFGESMIIPNSVVKSLHLEAAKIINSQNLLPSQNLLNPPT
jgi:hypothetical protein